MKRWFGVGTLLALLIVFVSDHASAIAIRVALNYDNTVDTLYRLGDKADTVDPDTCLTGFTCAALGTATCQFEAVDSDTIRITAESTDGICAMYKTMSGEQDVHMELEFSSTLVSNGENWAGGGLFIADSTTYPFTYRSDCAWWAPENPLARCKTDVGGATELGQTGGGTALPYSLGFEYEASSDGQSGWESADNFATDTQIGSTVTNHAFGNNAIYGVWANSQPNAGSVTYTFDAVVANNTLSFSNGGGGSPPTPPTGGFTVSSYTGTEGFCTGGCSNGGPAWPAGLGDVSSSSSLTLNDRFNLFRDKNGFEPDVYVCWTTSTYHTGDWTGLWSTDPFGPKCDDALNNIPNTTTLIAAIGMSPKGPDGTSSGNRDCQYSALWSKMANGDYDTYYTTFANNIRSDLQSAGRDPNGSDLILRLGWEMTGDWYSWSICNEITNFKTAWARVVGIIRGVMPDIGFDLSPAKAYPGFTGTGRNYTSGFCAPGGCTLDEWAPADSTYDFVSRSTHDKDPFVIDLTTWEQSQLFTSGNNHGLQEVLEFVQSKDKKMALTEWATQITDCSASFPAAPNPVQFLTQAHAWLSANSDWIAWDAYFSPSCTQLYNDNGNNTAARNKYDELWGDN